MGVPKIVNNQRNIKIKDPFDGQKQNIIKMPNRLILGLNAFKCLPWTGLRTNTLGDEDSIFLNYLAPGSYWTMAFQQLTKLFWNTKKQPCYCIIFLIPSFTSVFSLADCRPVLMTSHSDFSTD